MPCILNAANEIAVAAFLRREIGFMDMPRLVDRVMQRTQWIPDITLPDLVESNTEARRHAEEILASFRTTI